MSTELALSVEIGSRLLGGGPYRVLAGGADAGRLAEEKGGFAVHYLGETRQWRRSRGWPSPALRREDGVEVACRTPSPGRPRRIEFEGRSYPIKASTLTVWVLPPAEGGARCCSPGPSGPGELLRIRVRGLLRPRYLVEPREPVPLDLVLCAWLVARDQWRQFLFKVVGLVLQIAAVTALFLWTWFKHANTR